MNAESYQDAKNKVLLGDYSVGDFFEQNNLILEYGYCRLLLGDLEGANAAFCKIAKQDFRANWGKKLIPFIKGYISVIPSYFQIRNFLEIDLNLLIQSGQVQFVENIINCADLFYSVNPESYKFIARVMLYNNFTEIALNYLMKAKEKFYYDPEMHFMLASCYIKKGDETLAKEAINNCLNILPNYFPAKKLLGSIKSTISFVE
ncbi:MAG: hypothetical protein WCY19_01700 [Candidatus Gastranaerophilaceae bacterium]